MHTLLIVAICTSLSYGAIACDKKSGGGDGNRAKRFTKAVTVTLDELDGLKIDIAEGTDTEKVGGDIMIITMDESFTLGPASLTTPATLGEAKRQASKVDDVTKLKSETLSDGWLLEYQGKTSLGDTYYLMSRREIDGNAYYCGTSVGHKSLRDGAVTACKSLRK